MRASPPAQRYLRALNGVTAVVDSVPAHAWTRMSPCPPWTARDLLGHLIDGQAQIVSLLTGRGPRQVAADLAALGGADPVATWRVTVQGVIEVLAGAEDNAVVPAPSGHRTIDELLTIGIIEPLIHAWDLATAVGRSADLDAEAVRTTLAGVRALGADLAATGMYDHPRRYAHGWDEQDQLLAATGRDPHRQDS